MICLRCGYCCIRYEVVIVADPAKGISEGNLKHKESGKRCPHLVGDKFGEFSCAIHGRKWYKETPCHEYTQVEQENSPCRMGVYQRDRKPGLAKGKICTFCGKEFPVDVVWCKKCGRGGLQLTLDKKEKE